MTNETIKLLPCPFCGKQPEFDNYKIHGVINWNISCVNDDCSVHVETDDFELKEEAINAWNKRIY
jgi:Lar family restriction alleviation protein